jgi:hypothetical protein
LPPPLVLLALYQSLLLSPAAAMWELTVRLWTSKRAGSQQGSQQASSLSVHCLLKVRGKNGYGLEQWFPAGSNEGRT